MDFSVITPCFNSIRWIELCVRSVRYACRDLAFEHIVCDGGSTDGTLEYLRQQSDIRLISGPDRGMYDALNKGMAAARGRWYGHLNADEQYDRAGLRLALERLRTTGSDAVFGPTVMLDGKLDFLYLFRQITPPRPVDAEYQMPVQTCSLVCRREIWERFPYPSEYRMAGDHVWVRKQFQLGWKLRPQRNPIGVFAWHPDQLAPRHIGGKRENAMQDVDRKSLPIRIAKLAYRFRALLHGATIPPRNLYYEVMTPSGFAELRRQPWPRLKMPRETKRQLAGFKN